MDEMCVNSAAIDYVEWLLNHAVAKGTHEVVITSGRSLPALETFCKERGMEMRPSVEHVINRLKVLSGLSPVRYPEEKKGIIKKNIRSFLLEAEAVFQDRPEGSRARIRIVVRGRL